ncbi:sigma 54-interacting transcriptional regulator [Anaerovorax odorimutans]|uniref:HTH-type transcriptional regulatory protein TyrR n=1 Tax=Anaerovorax odorimutans TaxID=109327 RepID=A0ABT1RKR3_9FIRM|nr:sigma 54-interacting transcriptional regulator [Anaerovorax odorimutans]MCQ4635781.1 sigma 54-interacting transcriptional regulator [Anaerovorax odorimutans]
MEANDTKRLLEFIVENSPSAVIVVDKNGIIQKTNQRHHEESGFSEEELKGKHINTLIENRIISGSCSLRVIETKRPVLMEQIYKGSPHMLKALPLTDENGEVEYVISYILDISEKYNLISELEKTKFENKKYSIELLQARKELRKNNQIVFRSTRMRDLLERAEKIAVTDSTVLITGESGSGKGALAKYIHAYSSRSEESFLSINCGAIPENLVESELFGYEKGAFSGAQTSGKQGIFEYADKGTIFLDEIGDMPYPLQVKLLNVLQDKEFYKIGATVPTKVNVRIIAATNADLAQKIRENTFRSDLFYRLNVLSLHVPPLRQRPEDIPVLTEHFRKKINDRYNMNKSISPAVIKTLCEMHWPGNIRQLENFIERIMLFSRSDTVEVSDLDEANGSISLCDSEALADSLKQSTLKEAAQQREKELLIEGLKTFKTATALAKHLGVHQSTISRKLKKYGIW